MMKKRLTLLLAAALLSTTPATAADTTAPFQFMPPEGFVPDADTARKISEVVLIRLVGEAQVEREKPLTVSLEDGVWIVKGTMPPNTLGGIAEVHISKKDGTILFLSHGM
ncbi:MAG TPA: NTF2 fold immunity protein [Xanthobacteraceae bacterium]|jgi:hypothetical protein|nr:NTF2 fold immunity protein [Xanthobacteraceae bacterium]